jgi:hypothetical protein
MIVINEEVMITTAEKKVQAITAQVVRSALIIAVQNQLKLLNNFTKKDC